MSSAVTLAITRKYCVLDGFTGHLSTCLPGVLCLIFKMMRSGYRSADWLNSLHPSQHSTPEARQQPVRWWDLENSYSQLFSHPQQGWSDGQYKRVFPAKTLMPGCRTYVRASFHRARFARLPERLPESELVRTVRVALQGVVRRLLRRGQPP